MKYIGLALFFVSFFYNAQVVNKTDENNIKEDSLVIDSGKKDSLKVFKPTIQDYLYQTQFTEKKIFDTVFTYNKGYKYTQYNLKDNFGKIQFANIGSGYQPLIFEVDPEKNLSLMPTNKSFAILKIADIKYYDVKTPTTTFMYNNAMNNGAALHTLYTQNIGKRFNFSIEYDGLRSEGFYLNNLAANNNTLFTGHYISKNNHYEFFAHYLHQNVNNQENGGIDNLDFFLNGGSQFNTRTNLQVNLNNSSTQFGYRRYYFSQQYTPFQSEKFPFKIRHTIYNQTEKYYFQQSALESEFYNDEADLITSYPISSKKYSKKLSNTVSLVFDNSKFKLDAGVRHQLIKLGVGEPLMVNTLEIPGEISENRIGAVGNLEFNYKTKVQIDAHLEFSNGKSFGSFLRSENNLKFEPFKGYFVNAKVNFQTAAPSFNFLINPSVYKKFNYYIENPQNEVVTEIGGNIGLKWFQSVLSAQIFRIDHYTYINEVGQPLQSDNSLNISQISGEATADFKKFHLNTKLLFQSAISNKELFPMPNFVGRANFFYQTKVFKKAAELQTGIKIYYFSKFASKDYFPILNEFMLPNSTSYSIGGQPIADLYFNFKVKRMFFFIEGQHINNTFMKNKSYAAPYYPTYDFRLNIGIVWYLFS